MKNKETLSNCHRIKGIKAAQQLTLMSYVDGDPGREKGHQLKNKQQEKKDMKSEYTLGLSSNVPILASYCDKCIMVM